MLLSAITILAGAYFIGAIPWSYLLVRRSGHDLRHMGDGNIGAHNAMRHAGRRVGFAALALDAVKGAAAVWLGAWLGANAWWPVLAAWVAVLGHNYPVWLRFKGGKGLATGFGVVLALFPALAWLTLGGALVLVATTKNLAFSGAVLALSLACAAALQGYPDPSVAAPIGILVLMAWKQLPELVRMWRAAPDKRDLVVNRWIRDRDAQL